MEAVVHNFAEPHFGNIPLANVIPSKTNPRKRFDQTELEELATSIKQLGLAQPILVRPLPTSEQYIDCVEIVAGERRYRAAKLAGLEHIPAIVRDLTDVQALELQIIENLQRKDVHEIEEAEGYDQLMKLHGYTADQLADKVGKSRSYIYGRLKFCDLTPAVRETFFAGKLSASTALLVARIPTATLQEQATKEIVTPNYGEALSYRRAVEHVRSRYMLELEDAPFKLDDAKLVKAAGSCVACPKRTGSNPGLFADVDAPDVCTDPDCFGIKKTAHYAKVIAIAEKKGIDIYEDVSRKELTDQGLVAGHESLHSFERGTKDVPSWKPIDVLLQEDNWPAPAAYQKLKDGEVIALFDKGAIQLALEKAGICETTEQREARLALETSQENSDDVGDDGDTPSHRQSAAPSADAIKAEKLSAYRLRVYEALRTKLLEGQDPTIALRYAAQVIANEWSHPSPLKQFYNFNTYRGQDCEAYFATASATEIAVFLMEIALGDDALTVGQWEVREGNDPDEDENYQGMLDLAKQVGVDPEAFKDEPVAEAEKEAEPAPEPVKKKPKASAKKATVPAEVLNPEAAWPFPTAR